MVDFPGGPSIDVSVALLAVSVSADVLCRSVVHVDGILTHPVFTTLLFARSIRMNEPPPTGSSSKKMPCCLSSRVSLMWVSLSGLDCEIKPQRQACVDLVSLSLASLDL